MMPAFPLPEKDLKNIATFIYETTFEPPCKHWENEIRDSPDHNSRHVLNIKNNFADYCGD
jgi:hypothetical protein